MRLLKIVEETTDPPSKLLCQDPTSQTIIDGYSISWWTINSMINVIGFAIGGSAPRQRLVAKIGGERLFSRYVQLLEGFSRVSPKDGFGQINGLICDSLYKMTARTEEGLQIVHKVGAELPMLRWGDRVVEMISSETLTGFWVDSFGEDGNSARRQMRNEEGQGLLLGLEAAQGALQAYSYNAEAEPSLVLSMRSEVKTLIDKIFGQALELFDNPKLASTIGYQEAFLALHFIHSTLELCYKAGPNLAMLKRGMTLFRRKSVSGLPYLSVLGDIESRNSELSFRFNEGAMKPIDHIINVHYSLIKNILEANAGLKKNLSGDEQETFFWVENKITVGRMMSNFGRMMRTPEEGQTGGTAGVEPVDMCHAPGCYNNCNLSRCQRCKEVSYCGRDCQLRDWPDHKEFCKKNRKDGKENKKKKEAGKKSGKKGASKKKK